MSGIHPAIDPGHRPVSFLARPARTRFVFPDLDQAGAGADQAPAAVLPPDLTFGEEALARAMAAGASMARAAARAEAAASLDNALRLAADRLIEEAQVLARARREAARAAKAQVLLLVAAFADACLERIAGSAAAEAMLRAVEPTLAGLDAGTEVTVAVAPDLLDRVASLLAAAPGQPAMPGDGRIIVQARPDLAPGDISLSWRDGWAEWSLDRLRRALAEDLAAHPPDATPPQSDPAPAGPAAGDPTPDAPDLPVE